MATTKETVKKTPAKTVKPVKTEKTEAAVTVKPAVKASKTSELSVPVFSLAGKEAGTLDLPKSVFGMEINKPLLAQAMRVYLNNEKGHFSNTKTRGEVTGSTRKIYKQKGTGRARHGGITAPIFVGGGIALGPKARKVTLELPKKMKKASLISALSQKLLDKGVFGISGLDKTTGKTSELAKFIKAIEKKSALIITDKVTDAHMRASSNLKTVNIVPVTSLNALEVIKAQSLILTKEAVEVLEKKIAKKEDSSDSEAKKESK